VRKASVSLASTILSVSLDISSYAEFLPCVHRRRIKFMRLLRIAVLSSLALGPLSSVAHAQFTKTIEVVPNVQVNAVTTWYYLNCDTSLGLGSYTVNVAPSHGTLAFGDISAVVPGCPAGSPPLPAAVAYYTWTDTTSGATSDYFQLYFMLNGQIAEVIDITVLLETNPVSANILLDGKIISNSLTTVAVGKQIPLSASVNLSSGVTVASQSWTIPGNIVGVPYAALPNKEIITPITSEQLASSAVSFNWLDPADNRQVTYTYTLSNGQAGYVQASFDILAPTPQDPTLPLVTTELGSVGILGFPPDKLSFGGVFTPGITFTSNVQSPLGYAGNLYWIQLVNSDDLEKTKSDGAKTTCTASGLDNVWPNATWPYRTYVTDTPQTFLRDEYSQESVAESFTMYLLWQPSLPHSVPAPLGFISWGWSAAASLKHFLSIPYWALDGPGQSNAELFQPSTSYPPVWTINVRNNIKCSSQATQGE